jgi:hypothetical protein
MRYPQSGAVIPTGRVRDTGGVDVDDVSEAGAGASYNLEKTPLSKFHLWMKNRKPKSVLIVRLP